MKRPCGSRDCMRYVEQNGGDPESPSEWICAGCGAEGPMFKYFSQWADDEEDLGEDEASF